MSSWESLDSDQKDQIRQAFEICDADHNGFIDIEELKEVLKALGEVRTVDMNEPFFRSFFLPVPCARKRLWKLRAN